MGRHGAINPAGRVRSFNTNALIGDEHRARQLGMERDYLLLKPASASRPSGEWNDDDYDVLAGVVVGRIFGGPPYGPRFLEKKSAVCVR